MNGFGKTNRTCAVWIRNEYQGTFRFNEDVSLSAWMAQPTSEIVKDGDVDFDAWIPWCLKNCRCVKADEVYQSLKYSTDPDDHWWAGGPPDFFMELYRSKYGVGT